ncbi:MAG: portal protein [bacterium]
MAESIRTQFEREDAERSSFLDLCRECAALTIPSILLPLGQTAGGRIPITYQSIGADGLSTLVSKVLVALFPPLGPWFRMSPGPQVREKAGAAGWQAFDDYLYGRELQLISKFEKSNYRMVIRQCLESIFCVGNGLLQELDNYNYRSFRLDSWIPIRGSDGQILQIVVKEKVHVLELTDDQLALCEIKREDVEKVGYSEQWKDQYTRARLQRDGTWVITQEIKDKEFNRSEERVSPFIPIGYIELSGENHARGFIEERIGDLRSHNGLSKALLDGYIAMTMLRPIFDSSKGYTTDAFTRPNGVPVEGRVEGETPNGLAFLHTNKSMDMGGALMGLTQIEKRLGKQMLMESATQPQGERVTAYQVDRIRQEIDGALGGAFVNIAGELQIPLLKRLEHRMERDRLLIPIPAQFKKDVDISITTGLEALARQLSAQKLLGALQSVAQLPGALQEIRLDVAMRELFKGTGLSVDQFFKTMAEKQAEQQAAIAQQAQVAANEQKAKTAGNLMEMAAESQLQKPG